MKKLLKHRTSKTALEIIVIILVYFGIRTYMQWHLASGSIPTIQANMLSGKQFDSTIPRKGPVLLHFWASWCQICRLEQDGIQAISQDYPVVSVAMNSGDSEEVRQYLRQHDLSFPVINDPGGELARQFGVTGVPVSFVVDERNQIRFVERGYTTEWGLRMRLWLSH